MIKDFIRVYGFVCFILKMIKSLERSGVLYFFNILATQVKIEFIFAAFIYNVCISLHILNAGQFPLCISIEVDCLKNNNNASLLLNANYFIATLQPLTKNM